MVETKSRVKRTAVYRLPPSYLSPSHETVTAPSVLAFAQISIL